MLFQRLFCEYLHELKSGGGGGNVMEHENEIFIRNFTARLFFITAAVSILAALYHSTIHPHDSSKNSQDLQINKIRNREENFPNFPTNQLNQKLNQAVMIFLLSIF